MPEADVVYSDVRFTASKENSQDESTYSEVKLLGAEPVELAVSPPEASGGRSKVTERWLLLLLCVLLAAAVVALCLLSLDNIKTKNNLQTLKDERDAMRKNLTEKLSELSKENLGLKDERDAMRKNLTEKLSELSSCTTEQLIRPNFIYISFTVFKAEPCPTCEPDWDQHGGQCYYFSSSKQTWDQSRSVCKGRGADLVQIDSEEEQRFLENRVRGKMNDNDDKFWIGLTDRKVEGRWLWVDDSPLNTSLTFWHHKEPNNWTGKNPAGEDGRMERGRMGIRGGAIDLKSWFDTSCDISQRIICEKAAKTGR